jgi:hypothetical protein
MSKEEKKEKNRGRQNKKTRRRSIWSKQENSKII